MLGAPSVATSWLLGGRAHVGGGWGNIPPWRYHTLPTERRKSLALARQCRAIAQTITANQRCCLTGGLVSHNGRGRQPHTRRRPRRSDGTQLLEGIEPLIPGTRLELVRPEGRGILSPLRLPIPPPGRAAPTQCSRLGGAAQRGGPRLTTYGSGRRPPGPAPARRSCRCRRRFSRRCRSWS